MSPRVLSQEALTQMLLERPLPIYFWLTEADLMVAWLMTNSSDLMMSPFHPLSVFILTVLLALALLSRLGPLKHEELGCLSPLIFSALEFIRATAHGLTLVETSTSLTSLCILVHLYHLVIFFELGWNFAPFFCENEKTLATSKVIHGLNGLMPAKHPVWFLALSRSSINLSSLCPWHQAR